MGNEIIDLGNTLYQRHVETINGIEMHFITAGDERHPAIVLLHGFPEFWYGWRHQIPFLVNAGFRVIVPDQRGYNKTEKPRGIKHYLLDVLAEDIIALLDHLGEREVFLVGHDWGAAVAWQLAIFHAQRFKKLAILNVPHPSVMKKHIFSNFEQTRKSWYIFFFQLPWLPEWLMGRKKSSGGVNMLKISSFSTTFSDDDIAAYQGAWAHPRSWNGMINWYRAMFRAKSRPRPEKLIAMPVQIIWGRRDGALNEQMASDSLAYCADAQLELISRATHWVQHDAKEQVNEILLDFFSR